MSRASRVKATNLLASNFGVSIHGPNQRRAQIGRAALKLSRDIMQKMLHQIWCIKHTNISIQVVQSKCNSIEYLRKYNVVKMKRNEMN